MEWIRGPAIGRGATATVSLATAVPSGEVFAVKSAELCHSMFLQRETYVLSKLSCPYIVKYLGYDVRKNEKPTYNLCMEYVPGGTLSDEIQSAAGGKLDEDKIRCYSHQILQGLDYLHANGVVHCDIKSQNILLGTNHQAKIADLGCAKLVGEVGFDTSAFSGTPAFMAPEVARGEEQGFEADIWAFGCTVIEMSTGDSPWPELNDLFSAVYKIGFSGEVPEIPKWLSEECKDFVAKCLMWDSKERWTAKELLQHPFLEESDGHTLYLSMDSPSSVLDQGFWDSLDAVVEISPKNFIPQEISLMNSPTDDDRIKKLLQITEESPANSNASYWTWSSEDWITVRSIDGIEEDNSLESFEEEFEIESSSILDEEVFLENSTENVTDFFSSFLSFDCVITDESFVSDNLNFETVFNKISCSIPNPNLPFFIHVPILHVNFSKLIS